MKVSFPLAAAIACMLLGPAASALLVPAPAGPAAVVAVNVVPQELDDAGAPTSSPAKERAGQRLVSEGTYDCATGAPLAGGRRYAMDAVLARVVPAASAGVAGVSGTVEVLLGSGGAPPATVPPGPITFVVFLFCGGAATAVLPQPGGRQTAGVFGFHDENDWSRAAAPKATGAELTFSYRGPGADPVRSPAGFYMDQTLLWDGSSSLTTSTFRFALNPTFVSAYPGYAGSGYGGPDATKRCLFAGGDGLFATCGQSFDYGLTAIPTYASFPDLAPSAPAAGVLPPVLEDIDLYGAADNAVGVDVVSPAYHEAQAVPNPAAEPMREAYRTTFNRAFPARPLEPLNDPSGLEVPMRYVSNGSPARALGKGTSGYWVYYLDAGKGNSAPGTTSFDAVPFHHAGVSNYRDPYVGSVRFSAVLGLARDTNADGKLNVQDPHEWFPLDDLFVAPSGDALDVADVGTLGTDAAPGAPAADAVTIDDTVLWGTTCSAGRAASASRWYAPHEPFPPGDPAIAECNVAGDRLQGDAAAGWGTFVGSDSRSTGLGFYESAAFWAQRDARLDAPLSLRVSARVSWPDAEAWLRVAKPLPAGVEILALEGTRVYLTDVDVFPPYL